MILAKFPKILSWNSQNDLEGQGQWSPFAITAKSIPGCMFGANLVISAQICDELSCGQAEFPRILSRNGWNDLEVWGQWPPFSIPAESIPWCMFGANLEILAQICDELSCGQHKVYRWTDTKTHFKLLLAKFLSFRLGINQSTYFGLSTYWPLGNFESIITNDTASSLGTHFEIPLKWMPQKLTNEKSTLVQVMAWYRQATSHYLNQRLPRSMSLWYIYCTMVLY